MENRDRDQWGSDKQLPDSDSDVGFGKNTGRSDSFDEESTEDVEKYEDTTPMSQRGSLSEH